MAKPLTEYSQERIGKVWGEDDHLFLVVTLRKIDQVTQEIANLTRLREEIGRL